jgi:UDP-glucose 4-epimerase
MIRHIVTGGAGFIAATLIERLLERDGQVLALDDLSRGRLEYLEAFKENSRFAFARVDCTDSAAIVAAIREFGGGDHVWHMAANSDIPAGVADARVDLQQTFMTTFATLEAMRGLGIPALHFASSSAIYGDLGDRRIAEDAGPIAPISNYGAMKLASEAQISAAVEAWLGRADVFRFPNVVGIPATHGVILDFIRKLKVTPDTLQVLGDGTQRKPYLHAHELVEAILFIADNATQRLNLFNIGPDDEGVTVRFIAETVRDRVAPEAALQFGQGNKGWVGDVPRFSYSVDRLAELGWRPSLDSAGAIRRAVDEIARQEG